MVQVLFYIAVLFLCAIVGVTILSVAQGIFTALYTVSKRFRRMVDRICGGF